MYRTLHGNCKLLSGVNSVTKTVAFAAHDVRVYVTVWPNPLQHCMIALDVWIPPFSPMAGQPAGAVADAVAVAVAVAAARTYPGI